MKLILQECRPKWSLNQHHKNKRLLVQVVSHTGVPRHFNVFGQRKRTGTQGRQKVQNFAQWLKWITPFNYTEWFFLVLVPFGRKHFPQYYIHKCHQKSDNIFSLNVTSPSGWEAEGSVRSALTLYHCEAKEVQLFDSKKLCHTIENILPSGLWLEQVERQRSPY